MIILDQIIHTITIRLHVRTSANIIIIIIIIITLLELFTSALADGLSPEFKW